MLEKKLNSIEDLLQTQVRFDKHIIRKLAVHDTALCILAGSLSVVAPMVAAWSFKMNSELGNLDKAAGILEQRFNYYEKSNYSKTKDFVGGNSWSSYISEPTSCLFNRAALAKQSGESILYTDG
jgi:hypothetical protein